MPSMLQLSAYQRFLPGLTAKTNLFVFLVYTIQKNLPLPVQLHFMIT